MRREHNNDYFYHIYNRGVDKRSVFIENRDYVMFLESMRLFNIDLPIGSIKEHFERISPVSSGPTTGDPVVGPLETAPLVTTHAYCLNRNHYHFLLSQGKRNGTMCNNGTNVILSAVKNPVAHKLARSFTPFRMTVNRLNSRASLRFCYY